MPGRLLINACILALAVLAASCASAPKSISGDSAAPGKSDPTHQTLLESPRHHEWAAITHGERTVHCYVVYPEVSHKALAVIVIHENRGLNDWAKSVADQLAEKGFIAIAPDFLSGMAPGGGKTSDFADENAARDGIYQIPPEQVTADLRAVFDYAKAIPAANGKVALGGFCWGGAQTLRHATNQPGLAAAFVFYGSADVSAEEVERVACPVYGFYGGNDQRVNASIPDIEAKMKAAGKTYEPVIYEGAGHGFMRAGEAADASEANKAAMEQGWERWLELLTNL